ncbi:MAG: HEPN domain-containing protein [bacterium]
MKNKTDLVKSWIRKADNDLKTAISALEGKEAPPTDTICFHAQQCVEKYLKAYLVHNSIHFPYIHKLKELALLCATVDKVFEILSTEIETLTPYAVEIRYPDDDLSDPPVETAMEAVEIARKVKKFVLDRLPELPE